MAWGNAPLATPWLRVCTNIHSEDGPLTKDRNISNSSSRTDAIVKIVFGYVSARPPQRRNLLSDLDVS